MNKLWQLLDEHILKFGVAFTILFTALYPKLPSIQVTHTWVYVRLEDFVIAALVIIWLVQLLRRKVSFPNPEGYVIIFYWIAGLVSLLYCLLIIAPHLINFFPKIAVLQYFRRIEYMILFFIGFSSIKNKKDIRFYSAILFITATVVVLYGFGQRFYLLFWHAFPKFFEKNPFCFPAFLTGNEEFAKGTPFCLSETSRIAATFGGHYDLAAYLVFVIPVLIAVFLIVRRSYWKVLTAIISIGSIELLNFTSSRTSFAAYITGLIAMLLLWNKKRWIIPLLFVSILISIFSSNSVIQRFSKTIQSVKVVTINNNGNFPSNLQNIITKTKENEENQTPENPAPGSVTTATNTVTKAGSVTTVVTDSELKKLQEQDIAISTISGSFLIQKAYALDVSGTTRFQAEWPRDWAAFLSSPLLGTGYSSLTLASDNDYLRALGETGMLGALSFFFIFLILGIYIRQTLPFVKDDLTQAIAFGLAGGIIGLLCNAILIDVFEASKVAEPMWILLGIGIGDLALYQKKAVNYKPILLAFFTSRVLITVYLFIAVCIIYISSIHNFFVGDDFTWLHWAASSTSGDIGKYFTNASGFFYRPLAKTIMLALYNLFSFQPEGYHLFILVLHSLTALGVYLLAEKILKNKMFSFLAAVIFIILPSNAENVFWISTLSINLAAMFIIYAVIAFLHFRKTKKIFFYLIAFILGALSLLSYEGTIVIPLFIFIADIFLVKSKITKKRSLLYGMFGLLSAMYLYLHQAVHAVSSGGDYSYSIPHLIPNVLGNLLGYLGLFIFGPNILHLYITMRLLLKIHSLLFVTILVFIIVIMSIPLYQKRKIILHFFQNEKMQIMLFLLFFIFISLLPFLGLGNIAERYGYLASIGFAILLSHLILTVKNIYQKSISKIWVYGVGCIFLLLLAYTYITSLAKEQRDWNHAGNINAHTLKYIRLHEPDISPNSILYFVNVPIRYADAWVFPVGLSDGVWFIYRSDTMQVKQVESIEAAKAQSLYDKHPFYIFSFDKNEMISEVK